VIDLVANNGDHNCARMADGRTLCWGFNYSGEIGDGTTSYTSPPTPVIDGEHITQISAGTGFTCGVWTDGIVRCWGYAGPGNLGNEFTIRPSPEPVPGISGARFVAAGWRQTCVLLRDDSVWCWGNNEGGQLGDGTTTSRDAPAPVHF
jgi:alpha-tubulin suppressor-like RCC1 family protein